MLGVVIGLLSAVSLLVFFQKDPEAVRKRKEEKQKQEKEREEALQKAREEF